MSCLSCVREVPPEQVGLGLEFRSSLPCHSALLNSAFLFCKSVNYVHVSHDDSLSLPLLEAVNTQRQVACPLGGTSRHQLGAKVIIHPYTELQGTLLIESIPRPFRLDNSWRGHLGSSKIGSDKQVTLI